MCINSQNIVCFFPDVVNTCVVYIEQATAGRGEGGGGSAAIYHRLYVRSYKACVSPFCFLFFCYIFHSLHFTQVMYVTVGYIFQTAAGLARTRW